jgi:hypothetical protein
MTKYIYTNGVYNAGDTYLPYASQGAGGVKQRIDDWFTSFPAAGELRPKAIVPTTLVPDPGFAGTDTVALTAPRAYPGGSAGSQTAGVAFILSIAETAKYYPNAIDRGSVGDSNSWWLRGPSDFVSGAAFVSPNGTIDEGPITYTNGLRPAIWIRLAP